MVSRISSAASCRRATLLMSSGLDRFSFETKLRPNEPDRVYIVYRHPVTGNLMTTPDGKPYPRWRLFSLDAKGRRYMTSKNGGIHLYFPSNRYHGNVVEFLKANPDTPLYITEGEKKAAKAWVEGIPCIGIQGMYNWLANKEDREGEEKTLHPDFDLIPDLKQRTIIMIYDSDANEPEKQKEFNRCSKAFEKCLRARGVSRYEKIVLPGEGERKVGLDDYLMEHTVSDFEKVVIEQSKQVPLGKYIMTSPEFLSTKFPPIRFILQPWLMDCGLTMIHARPGVGKTYFLLGLSAAITRRKPPEEFCGWKIKQGAGVLFVDGEMPSAFMQSRLAKVEAAYPGNPASKKRSLSLLSCMDYSRQTGKQMNFSDEDCRNEFTKILRKHPAKVIILDNIVSLMAMKDENDAGAWSPINQWLLYLRHIGKSVILVHHSSKKGSQRGTSHHGDNLARLLPFF